MTTKKTVVIVDDHLLIAKAISSIIDEFDGFKVIYECETGELLMEKFSFAQNIPDIVLLDISMPELDGFEVAKWLKHYHPSTMVMALTMQADDDSVIKMIKCGAKGYLHKNVHPAELEKALVSLVRKGYYYPDWATSKVLYSMATADSPDTSVQLNDKERIFLEYACTELTYKEIGEKMYCSPRTVEGYRDGLFEKLNVRTRVALALYAVKIGLYKV